MKAPLLGMLILCLACVVSALCAHAYQEAPMLAEKVAKGELPPVDQRLPREPAVVEPISSIGQYGGTWRRVANGVTDLSLDSRLGYEPLVRWDRTGQHVTPGLASRWEVEDGGKRYVFHLREGLRWSDGQPFTSEDFKFYFEDVLGNRELTPIFPKWLNAGGQPVSVSAPDPLTVVFEFVEPYGIFLEMLCFRGNWTYLPKHYCSQFHTRYADAGELAQKTKARGFELWFQLFSDHANFSLNPDLPTCRPFQIKTRPPASRIIAERNPYYWKVDPEGNQLPYIDRIAYTDIQNPESATFRAIAGEVDFQARGINPEAFPLFMENREKGGYRVLRDPSPTPVILYVNQHSKDDVLRPILKNKRFRVALSVSINRKELIDLLFSGRAAPTRGVAGPFDPYYLPEYDQKHIQYDPDLANRLLDEAGLPRGPGGMRLLPNGRPFRQVLSYYPSETGTGNELWQLVADYFREVGLDFTVKADARYLSVMQVSNGNSDFWGYASNAMHWVLDPLWYVPYESVSYFAPLYGKYVATRGKGGVEPPEELMRLLHWYEELRASMDPARRLELGRKILGQWAEECYTIGICMPDQLTIVSNRFRNAPDSLIHSWLVMSPGYLGIEQFYLEGGGKDTP